MKKSYNLNFDSNTRLVVSKEEAVERINFWRSLEKKYEDLEDDESNGLDLDTLVRIEEAKEPEKKRKTSEEKLSGKRSIVEAIGKLTLKMAFSDQSSDEEVSEGESTSGSEDDFVEQPTDNQMVPHKPKTEQELWDEMHKEYGLEFIEDFKRQIRNQKEMLSSMNLPFFNESSSSSRYNERFNENCLITADTKSYARQHEVSYEQNNQTKSSSFQPGSLRNEPSNVGLDSALKSQGSLSFQNYATPIKAMSPEIMQLMKSGTIRRLKVVEREYYIETDQTMIPALETFHHRPDLLAMLKPKLEVVVISSDDEPKDEPSPVGSDAQFIVDSVSKAADFVSNSKSNVITSKSRENKSRACLFQTPSDTSVREVRINVSKINERVMSTTTLPSKSYHSLNFESTENASKFQSTSSIKEKNSIPKKLRRKDLNSVEEPKDIKEKKKRPSKVTRQDKALNSTEGKNKNSSNESSPSSKLAQDEEFLIPSDVSIGSSYHTESSEDEKFWNKEKFEKLRKVKQEQHKKKKFLARTLESAESQEASKSSNKSIIIYSSSDEESPEAIAETFRKRATKRDNSVTTKDPILTKKHSDLSDQNSTDESKPKRGKKYKHRQTKNTKKIPT